MTETQHDLARIKNVVNDALLKHGTDSDELIPVLLDTNDALGYLPTTAMAEISQNMKLPISRVYSVASFYNMLSTEPRGKHVIQFCESAPCHIMGGRKVLSALLQKLSLKPGETTPDGQWTLILTSCLGTCGVGPVMIVDDELFGNVTEKSLDGILGKYGWEAHQ